MNTDSNIPVDSAEASGFPTALEKLMGEGIQMWLGGGWGMIALSIVAFVMFCVGLSVLLKIYRAGLFRVPPRTWIQWLDHPEQRQGSVGRLIEGLAGKTRLKDVAHAIDAIRIGEIEPFDRELRVMKVCVGAAPLLGLLGTVTGMLSTFDALSTGSGGDKTMELVAAGISEALITTETGLVIALPGLFFHFFLSRKSQASKRFVAQLESVCNQRVLKGTVAAVN